MKPKILVVEDRPENLAAARESYAPRDEYHFDFAQDFDEAMEALGRTPYTGIITDCFMPKKTGSGDVSLGLSLVERLAPVTPEIKEKREKFHEKLESYRELLDVDNPEVQRALYINGGLHVFLRCVYNGRDKQENTARYLEQFGIEPYKGESDNWGHAEGHIREGKWVVPTDKCVDYPWILEQMMKQTEAAQPLGVLIVDYARANNIPHFMLTARHNIGSDPIEEYCKKNSVPFEMPRESEKKGRSYWLHALSIIEAKLADDAKR